VRLCGLLERLELFLLVARARDAGLLRLLDAAGLERVPLFADARLLADVPLERVLGAEPFEARLVFRPPDVDLLVLAITHPSLEDSPCLPDSVPAKSGH
jgi:hypothetical protein